MYNYKALVTNIVDGDTFDAIVDLGFTVSVKVRFRVANFDAPESYRPKTEAEATHGKEAAAIAKDLIGNKEIIITSYKEGRVSTGSFGRWLVRVILPDGRDFAEVMIENGMEKPPDYEI